MKYFPIFLNIENQPIAVVGGGDAAVAKLRLLLKTEDRSRSMMMPLPQRLRHGQTRGF